MPAFRRRANSRIRSCLVAPLLAFAATAAAQHIPNELPHVRQRYPVLPFFIQSQTVSDSDAARFLAQATFGPTPGDIAHVKAIGYSAWVAEQVDPTRTPVTREMDYFNWVTKVMGEPAESYDRQEAWFLGALGGPDPANSVTVHNDQLRQRVAFALSEIFVVSDKNDLLADSPAGMATYYDILINDAFGNYRQLLEDVTLSPAMGNYLNMRGNQRADAKQNIHPDENYAREINQLFSIGLTQLNADGSGVLVAGVPVATYGQDQIKAFAHVFTGWNWSDCTADNFVDCDYDWTTDQNMRQPMVAFADFHDNGTHAPDDLVSKQLLQYPGAANGGLLVAGGTPASDLKFALDNIFNHPNVGPFIGKQLIQHLVTSNPSAAYVQRVASIFANNGAGVRGDLKAVITAILLDPEARSAVSARSDSYGKLREPLLRLTHLWRVMGARHNCGSNFTVTWDDGSQHPYHYQNQPYRYAGWSSTFNPDYDWGQAALRANSVFNFFKPSFTPPGEMAQRGLLGPEFQITTDAAIVTVTGAIGTHAMYYDVHDVCDVDDQYGDVVIDHARDVALAGSGNGGPGDPADRLVDAYNLLFMSGQMSSYMRGIVLDYLNQIDSTWANNGEDWRVERIKRALFLILTSPEYAVQK